MCRKLVENADDGLSALRAVFLLGVGLVTAEDETVGKILEDLELFGLCGPGRAVGEE